MAGRRRAVLRYEFRTQLVGVLVAVLLGSLLGGPFHASSTASKSASGLGAADPSPIEADLSDSPPACGHIVNCGAARMVYDAADGYAVAFLLCPGAGDLSSCTWKFSDGSWTNISSSTGPNPPPLSQETFVWDAADRCALLFGGLDLASATWFTFLWSFQNGGWTNLTSSVPPEIPGAPYPVATYDSRDGYVVSVWTAFANPALSPITWTYRGGTWENVTPPSWSGARFPYGPTAVDDPSDQGALFFGGLDATDRAESNVSWLFSGGTWHVVDPRFEPPVRSGASMAYDSLAGYVLLVGGIEGPCTTGQACVLASDEWTFADGQWTNITDSLRGNPPQEQNGQMVTDPADRYVLEGFGEGLPDSSGTYPAQVDFYTYSNGTWTLLAAPSPAAGFPWVEFILLAMGVAIGGLAIAVVVVRRRRKD